MAETITVIASTSLSRILMADAGLVPWVGPLIPPALGVVEKFQRFPMDASPQPTRVSHCSPPNFRIPSAYCAAFSG